MKNTAGYFVLSCMMVMISHLGGAEAFVAPAGAGPPHAVLKSRASSRIITNGGVVRAVGAAARRQQGGGKQEPELTVFDAGESAVSWEDYKKQKPDEYKLDEVDEMTCWKTDECPVEDPSRFTKAWDVRSAERNPTTETHFDSEGEWEEESKWSKKWYADVGEDDLHEEIDSPASKGGLGI